MEEQNFSFIDDHRIQDNILYGNLLLFDNKKKVDVSIDVESEKRDLKIEDFEKLSGVVYKFIDDFNPKIYKKIEEKVSKEITDSAYSQSDLRPSDQDYLDLQKDLEINTITFYDSDFVIFFKANNVFPNMEISAQIEYDFEILDIIII